MRMTTFLLEFFGQRADIYVREILCADESSRCVAFLRRGSRDVTSGFAVCN
mgnify:CR=1 FL=1